MKIERVLSVLSRLVILLFVFFVGQYVGSRMTPVEERVEIAGGAEESEVSIMFDYGDGTFDVVRGVSFSDGDSVFDAVLAAAEDGDIEVEYEDYGEELGAFITSIHGFGGGEGGAFWQYWINNEYQNTGMSSTFAMPGDAILLKLTGHNPGN